MYQIIIIIVILLIAFPKITDLFDIFKISEPLMYFEKTICLGTCPIYKVTLFDNGEANYEGIDYVTLKGKHRFKVSKTLIDKIKGFDVSGLKNVYDENITDVPSTILKFKGKKIVARWNYPKRLEELIDAIHNEIMNKIGD